MNKPQPIAESGQAEDPRHFTMMAELQRAHLLGLTGRDEVDYAQSATRILIELDRLTVPAPPAESERVSTKRRIAVVIDGEKYVPHSHKISDEAVRLAKELVLETRDGIHAKASRLLYLLTDASGRAR